MSLDSSAGLRPLRSRKTALGVQWTSIKALLLRDLGSRHEGSFSGFIWTFGEPIIVTAIVLMFHWSAGGGGRMATIPAAAFVLTGYSPHLLLRHTGVAGVGALQHGTALLYHRTIHYFDIVIAKFLLEIFYVIISFIFIYTVFIWAKILHTPILLGYFYLGWILQIWFALAICLIVTGAALRWPLVKRAFQPFTYAMIPVYGAFFMLSWIPTPVRTILLLFPPANATEIMRHGYFGAAVTTYYNLTYTILCCLALTVLGFYSLWSGRKWIEL